MVSVHSNLCACVDCIKVIKNYNNWKNSNIDHSDEFIVDNGNGMILYRYSFKKDSDSEFIIKYIVHGLWTYEGEYSIKSIPDLIEFCKINAMLQ